MRQKLLALLLALGLMLSLAACGASDTPSNENQTAVETDTGEEEFSVEACPADQITEPLSTVSVEKGGHYNTKDEVFLYLITCGSLPENYITTEEAREMGWTGGSVETVAPGYSIGGDVFDNGSGVLQKGRQYYQCDVDIDEHEERSSHRLIYASDLSFIYYTGDNGESFQLLYRST